MLRCVRTILAVATLGAVLISTAAGPATSEPTTATAAEKTAAADYLAEVVADQKIPGLAATVLSPGVADFEWTSGADGNGAPITRNTSFLIGSLAKSMTAAAVMQHVDRGVLALTDPVGDHLPWLVATSPTVEELLTHTSGFSGADGLAVAERFDNSPGAVRRAAEDLEYSGTQGQYEYSDANYLILGALLEQFDGKPFGEVLRTDLLEPLDMRGTATTSDAASDLPPGHRYWWGSPRRYSPGFDESGTPFGYVASTLDDLARYARAHAGANPDVLDPELLRQLHTPRVDAGDDDYGYGWRITPSDLGPLVHHTGATPGYFAHVMLGPDGQAAVVLANAYSEAKAPVLASIAENVLLMLNGQSTATTDGDPLITALPWVVSAVAALGLALAVTSWWRPARRVLRWTTAVAAIAIVSGLCLLPSFFGADLRVMRLWMPDAAIMLILSLITWSLAAALLMLPVRSSIALCQRRFHLERATGQ